MEEQVTHQTCLEQLWQCTCRIDKRERGCPLLKKKNKHCGSAKKTKVAHLRFAVGERNEQEEKRACDIASYFLLCRISCLFPLFFEVHICICLYLFFHLWCCPHFCNSDCVKRGAETVALAASMKGIERKRGWNMQPKKRVIDNSFLFFFSFSRWASKTVFFLVFQIHDAQLCCWCCCSFSFFFFFLISLRGC